ncbi:hypothetical protein BJP36_43285 [Moorena producens JHB]|uniref:Uncharacterized protein n=1 Tax=Moorena producens (strain JHB) TaxID=1454205 RepID=A0A9Q9ST61_MOOP1|nr:hypothetical protein [Moorena producens]WAN69187.1 hypothetical protein BJP36_43285 [Moorena producens JHB]
MASSNYTIFKLSDGNLPFTERQRRTTWQPWPIGHASRTTCNLQPVTCNL